MAFIFFYFLRNSFYSVRNPYRGYCFMFMFTVRTCSSIIINFLNGKEHSRNIYGTVKLQYEIRILYRTVPWPCRYYLSSSLSLSLQFFLDKCKKIFQQTSSILGIKIVKFSKICKFFILIFKIFFFNPHFACQSKEG